MDAVFFQLPSDFAFLFGLADEVVIVTYNNNSANLSHF